MITLSAWIGQKGVFLAATLSVYTFALTYVFRALEYGHYKTLSPFEHSKIVGFQSRNFIVPNSSRRSLSEALVWKESHISPILNTYQNKLQGTLSVKLNVKHTPRTYSPHSKSNKIPDDSSTYFRARLQDKDFELLRKTVEVFDFVMSKIGVDYMIYGGTLVGSYRHHGLVPWDDDVDVLVPLSAKRSLYPAFKHIRPDYILNNDWVFSWKLFSVKADPIRGFNWRWPYVDIFFYAENETHIWDVAPQYNKKFVYPKNIVFPLRRRPFMGFPVLGPHNPRAVLDTNYNISLCKSGTWIHKWERYGTETSVPCSLLHFKFPFVWRTSENGGCNESLIHNRKTIGYFFDKDIRC